MKYIIIYTICFFCSLYGFSQKNLMTKDSLQHYLEGKWIGKEYKCWDSKRIDSVSRKMEIIKNNVTINEELEFSTRYFYSGDYEITEKSTNYYGLKIRLDETSTQKEYNTLFLGDINILSPCRFSAIWYEVNYMNGRQVGINYLGTVIFQKE